jgi:hypothetical protein
MPKPFDVYELQLARAANRLVQAQRIDGGWGLTPTSVSSIVNTAEALTVFRAADMAGPAVEKGIAFLLKALPVFYRDEPTEVGGEGGRGRHLRYVSFFLDGLLNYADVAFAGEGLDRIQMALRWLGEFPELLGGIPESVGGSTASLHQTSRVLGALARLLFLDDTNPSLPPTYRAGARTLADSAARYLLNLQGASGAWPVEPDGPPGSAAKTALATTALGYYALIQDSQEIAEARRRGGSWLMNNYSSWSKATSTDRRERSTYWVHLDYAECVRGVMAGTDGGRARLKSSWQFLVGRWSPDLALWSEPAADDGNVTIRAAYHTVMAFESAKDSSALLRPAPLEAAKGQAFGSFVGIRIDESRGGRLLVEGTEATFPVSLTGRQHDLVLAVLDRPDGISAEELGEKLGVGAASVPMYMSRINARISAASAGRLQRVFIAHRLAGGRSVYTVGDGTESG